MFIPDPDFYLSRIIKRQQKRGVKKNLSYQFQKSHQFHKIEHYFIFEKLKKIIWANFQRMKELFTKKIVKKLLRIWVWDPGSGRNLFRIPDPGVKKAPDPGSGSATLDIIVEIVSFVSQKVLQRRFPAFSRRSGTGEYFLYWVPSTPTSYYFVYG
jgi:hypothetical protein